MGTSSPPASPHSGRFAIFAQGAAVRYGQNCSGAGLLVGRRVGGHDVDRSRTAKCRRRVTASRDAACSPDAAASGGARRRILWWSWLLSSGTLPGWLLRAGPLRKGLLRPKTLRRIWRLLRRLGRLWRLLRRLLGGRLSSDSWCPTRGGVGASVGACISAGISASRLLSPSRLLSSLSCLRVPGAPDPFLHQSASAVLGAPAARVATIFRGALARRR